MVAIRYSKAHRFAEMALTPTGRARWYTQMRMVKKYIVITLLILIAAVIVRILRTMA